MKADETELFSKSHLETVCRKNLEIEPPHQFLDSHVNIIKTKVEVELSLLPCAWNSK